MTPFSSIYELFFNQIDDYELGLIDDETMVEFLYNHLVSAIVEFKICKTDLTKREKSEIGNLVLDFEKDNTSDITKLLPLVREDLEFNLYDGEVKLERNKDFFIKFSKDEKDNVEKLEIIITNQKFMKTLKLTWIYFGGFKSDLAEEEKMILALGMLSSWLNHKVYREDNLTQTLGDTDYKGFSNANMVARLVELKKLTDSQLKKRIKNYSYNGFSGLG
ncbi:hypothetical protein N2W52_002114 [Clostridium perfringens]|nr:hypothetical protein [Clostridium perfringens]